jgi:uncharacterized protein
VRLRSCARSLAAAVAVVALAAAGALAQGLQPVPALTARVTDLTGTLRDTERAALEEKLRAFEERKGAQVAVLIVETTEPEAIEQYSIRVVEAWRLGREASDDGALLIVAKNDRALRIEVGRGLEGALTDATSNRIIDEAIVPRFRAGDFAGGIEAGVDRMLGVIDGEPLPAPDATWRARGGEGRARGLEDALPFLVFAVPVAGSILRAIFGSVLGPLVAGGVLFAIGLAATGSTIVAVLLALVGALFAAFAGRRPRGRGRRGRHGGFGGIPGGWGGSSGGFGGGGFSGGGGSFGGGGASGRW